MREMIHKLLEERVSVTLLRPKVAKTPAQLALLRTSSVLETYLLSGRKGMFSLGAQTACVMHHQV